MKLVYSSMFKTGSTAPGKEGPVILSSASELAFIGYFQRSSVLEMFTFFARTFANNSALVRREIRTPSPLPCRLMRQRPLR